TGPDCRREVVASTFDEPPPRHVALAEMALAKAQRMVEAGRDVVLVLDSLTQLVRAYNQEVPHSGKLLAAGLDASALHKPKRLFGAARNLEEGGSLTVIATMLTATDSRIDQAIAEEFRNKGNCEVVLDHGLAELHVYPALDVLRTGTRREDCLLLPAQVEQLRRLRAELAPLPPRERLERLLARCERAADNATLLAGC
ncbi:MAG TPA: transcription termination factor Rho, partial [Planctomycetota bacterium]|nr:transcription termination factor Rho [Planctomycetota bacterium]